MTNPTPVLTLCETSETGIPGLESFSPFCLKAHRALKLAKLPYARKHGNAPRDHRRHNPTGQVPVLLVGDRAVADSTAILHEIETLAPGSLTRGLEARATAEAWLWEDFADTSLNGFLVASRWADERNWPGVAAAYFSGAPAPVRLIVPRMMRRRVLEALRYRDVTRAGMEALWARFGNALDQLESRAPAAGMWMGGDEATVADVSLFGQLHGLRNRLTPWQRDEIAKREVLSAWLDRVHTATFTTAVS